MNIGGKWGESVRKRYQQTGCCDLDLILIGEGLSVMSCDFAGELDEVRIGRYIVIDTNVDEFGYRRTLISHAIGHYFLHFGNQLFLAKRDNFWVRKTENQANNFAYHLLIPDDELIICLRSKETVWGLAEKYKVPEPFVVERLGLLKQERPELWQVV